MKQRRQFTLSAAALAGAAFLGIAPAKAMPPIRHPAKWPVAPKPTRPDPRTVALLKRMAAVARATRTMTADFTYSVTSVRRQQFVTGSVWLMKPNFARITFSYMDSPAFPNLVASDGKTITTFTPASFQEETRTFRADRPFEPALGAKQASGLEPGGGTFHSSPAPADGAQGGIHLWDAVPIQAFFDPVTAIRSYIYVADPNTLKYDGERVLDGVTYRVLSQHFEHGEIAGGESSAFEQHLYVGPDDRIAMYVLEFVSAGHPGVQVVRLKNVRVNIPMNAADFVFTPPTVAPAADGGAH